MRLEWIFGNVVLKSLQVLEFILKRGGEEGIRAAKDEFPELLVSLLDFKYIGTDGRDYGINVRVRYFCSSRSLLKGSLEQPL